MKQFLLALLVTAAMPIASVQAEEVDFSIDADASVSDVQIDDLDMNADLDRDLFDRNEVCYAGRYGRQGRLKQVYRNQENQYWRACEKAMRNCRRDIRNREYCEVMRR